MEVIDGLFFIFCMFFIRRKGEIIVMSVYTSIHIYHIYIEILVAVSYKQLSKSIQSVRK